MQLRGKQADWLTLPPSYPHTETHKLWPDLVNAVSGEFISTSLVYVQHICCVLCQWPCTTGQGIQMFNGKYLVVLLGKYLVVSLCTDNETCFKYVH